MIFGKKLFFLSCLFFDIQLSWEWELIPELLANKSLYKNDKDIMDDMSAYYNLWQNGSINGLNRIIEKKIFIPEPQKFWSIVEKKFINNDNILERIFIYNLCLFSFEGQLWLIKKINISTELNISNNKNIIDNFLYTQPLNKQNFIYLNNIWNNINWSRYIICLFSIYYSNQNFHKFIKDYNKKSSNLLNDRMLKNFINNKYGIFIINFTSKSINNIYNVLFDNPNIIKEILTFCPQFIFLLSSRLYTIFTILFHNHQFSNVNKIIDYCYTLLPLIKKSIIKSIEHQNDIFQVGLKLFNINSTYYSINQGGINNFLKFIIITGNILIINKKYTKALGFLYIGLAFSTHSKYYYEKILFLINYINKGFIEKSNIYFRKNLSYPISIYGLWINKDHQLPIFLLPIQKYIMGIYSTFYPGEFFNSSYGSKIANNIRNTFAVYKNYDWFLFVCIYGVLIKEKFYKNPYQVSKNLLYKYDFLIKLLPKEVFLYPSITSSMLIMHSLIKYRYMLILGTRMLELGINNILVIHPRKEIFHYYDKKFNIDHILLRSIMAAETQYTLFVDKQNIVNHDRPTTTEKSYGLIQLNLNNARKSAFFLGKKLDMTKLFNNCNYGIELGMIFLHLLKKEYSKYHIIRLIAGYNGGYNLLNKWHTIIKIFNIKTDSFANKLLCLDLIPWGTTQHYTKKVINLYYNTQLHKHFKILNKNFIINNFNGEDLVLFSF